MLNCNSEFNEHNNLNQVCIKNPADVLRKIDYSLADLKIFSIWLGVISGNTEKLKG